MVGSHGKKPILWLHCRKKLDSKPRPAGRLYGRKQTRPPKGARRDAMETLLPALQLGPDPVTLPPWHENNTWFEIGFGNGEHLAGLMERYPERRFIGAEPFINGMSAFLKLIRDVPHDNIRVWMDDAILLIDAMPDEYLDGIYVLNPDPWPKKRHHKRRIISQENLTKFARVLKAGGQLIMASDVDDLSEWMVTQASNHDAFEWTATRADDWRLTPPEWIKTRYEEKGEKAGRKQSYLFFKKREP